MGTVGSSVTINSAGTYFAWIAKKSPPYGFGKVTLAGGGVDVNIDAFRIIGALDAVLQQP